MKNSRFHRSISRIDSKKKRFHREKVRFHREKVRFHREKVQFYQRKMRIDGGARHVGVTDGAQQNKKEGTTSIGVIPSVYPEVPSRFELLYTVLQTVA